MILTRPQSIVARKVASHFKISQKLLRSVIDESQPPLLIFNELETVGFSGNYYCVEGRVGTNELLNEAKIKKTKLYQDYLDMQELGPDIKLAFCVSGNVLIVKRGVETRDGWGGIVVSYPDLLHPLSITTIKNDLSLDYPLPPA